MLGCPPKSYKQHGHTATQLPLRALSDHQQLTRKDGSDGELGEVRAGQRLE
jgi:hypothetical protein